MDNFVATPTKRIKDYEKLAYGLFLHWGLYSTLEQGEWIKHHHKLPKEEYEKLINKFTAKDFDADSIVKFAKDCGFKYICITTRHHEGFSLYDTRGLNEYDAPHSPAGRDLIKEFADACHKYGMAMFFYHTTLDWYVDSFENDWDAYLEYLNVSVEILCKHYGKVSGFWFDGNWSKRDADWKEDKLYGLIRKYQPDCIIINNSSINALGKRGHQELDVVTFEQGTPEEIEQGSNQKYLASEMCDTMNSHWGIASNDFSFKSPADIINNLAMCRRNGANYLLNVGPTPEGKIPEYEAAVLKIVGKWINTSGKTIYEGLNTGLPCKGNDFVLRLNNDYYYFLFNLPIKGNGHLLKGESGAGLKTIQGQIPKIKRVSWVDNNEELQFSQDTDKGMLTFYATDYPYGNQMIVRVAKLEF